MLVQASIVRSSSYNNLRMFFFFTFFHLLNVSKAVKSHLKLRIYYQRGLEGGYKKNRKKKTFLGGRGVLYKDCWPELV